MTGVSRPGSVWFQIWIIDSSFLSSITSFHSILALSNMPPRRVKWFGWKTYHWLEPRSDPTNRRLVTGQEELEWKKRWKLSWIWTLCSVYVVVCTFFNFIFWLIHGTDLRTVGSSWPTAPGVYRRLSGVFSCPILPLQLRRNIFRLPERFYGLLSLLGSTWFHPCLSCVSVFQHCPSVCTGVAVVLHSSLTTF